MSALLPLSAGALPSACSFSAVDSSDFDSLSAGRLLSAVGSEALSVTVAVMPLSVLAGSLPVFSVLKVKKSDAVFFPEQNQSVGYSSQYC